MLRVTAIPQTCEDGGWVTICNDGTNNENLPNIICQEAGYRGSIKRLNIVFFNHFLYCLGGYELSPNRTMFGASGPGTFYVNNVTCNGSVDNCDYQNTFSAECLSGNYDYVVQCYNHESKILCCCNIV